MIIHLLSVDLQAKASWYVDKLGAEITSSNDVGCAPQIRVAFKGATLTGARVPCRIGDVFVRKFGGVVHIYSFKEINEIFTADEGTKGIL